MHVPAVSASMFAAVDQRLEPRSSARRSARHRRCRGSRRRRRGRPGSGPFGSVGHWLGTRAAGLTNGKRAERSAAVDRRTSACLTAQEVAEIARRGEHRRVPRLPTARKLRPLAPGGSSNGVFERSVVGSPAAGFTFPSRMRGLEPAAVLDARAVEEQERQVGIRRAQSWSSPWPSSPFGHCRSQTASSMPARSVGPLELEERARDLDEEPPRPGRREAVDLEGSSPPSPRSPALLDADRYAPRTPPCPRLPPEIPLSANSRSLRPRARRC